MRSRPFSTRARCGGVVLPAQFLATPGSAWGVSTGSPYIFEVNLHYAAPTLILAMVSAGIALSRCRGAWLLPVIGSAIVLTGIDSGRRLASWSPAMGGAGFEIFLVASLGGGAVALALTQPARRRWAAAGALVTAVAVLVGALMIAADYPRLSSTDTVERWAASMSRVKNHGLDPDVAWLYGPGSTNRVVTLTRQERRCLGRKFVSSIDPRDRTRALPVLCSHAGN